ncbi:TetR/AcrR family transcriptional regulator [Planococcus sp. CP5-4]|uniref:TetR/AcrR family transcriptional regulator n=1 Tax=unclassified Planococcus (in: firmicutes) TaxID=2662419 RepID=UPI001C22F3AB|nr:MULTISPECIES: TetR/AcrR family transcriptional regulator [unclassified Planococcus (in: firmicutes)]MBU9674947.1 TetR/AcrR family transcriptional regulator [Planococcus sp. CP5-4_YE]MBV0908410.1 TetR/AcrR family transcriptional regulator [Planococcus sp. CP5-4_UN]MBW6062624.1 TetR/AcrR family transcriptional regulator [Planococcus sp. CP5-4]
MHGKSADLRVVRTKQAIRSALIALIEKKGFEAMSVKDITEKANINRGTFYSHYEDKFDLMDKCQQQLIEEMEIKIIRNIPQLIEGMKQSKEGAVPFAVPVPLFEFLHHNKSLMKALLGPKGDAGFQVKMKEFLRTALFERNKDVLVAGNLLVPPRYLSSYIASAHIGVIQEWLNGDTDEPPEEIARIISTMTINGPFFAAGLKGQDRS